jgi:hypothetical protein
MRAGSIAAGIHAGIGTVAAGSVFATLTIAAMFGFGLPVVLGGVWGISSAVLWGIAWWKKGHGNGGAENGILLICDGTEDDEGKSGGKLQGKQD